MKQNLTLIILFLTFLSCNAQTQKTVDFGYIKTDWTYKNDGLNLSFPLIKGWYFMDADTKKLVKVGTDVKILRAYTSAFQVPIQEFKKNNTDRIATLIAITKLNRSKTCNNHHC